MKSAELRTAKEEEGDLLLAVVEKSYAREQAWGATTAERLKELKELVTKGLGDKQFEFLVLADGNRFLAASGVVEDANSARHLTTGVCVLDEYRCRGLGSYMLYQTLAKLKEKGLKEASVVTQSNVSAAKFLYPKFGSKSSKLEALPPVKISKKSR